MVREEREKYCEIFNVKCLLLEIVQCHAMRPGNLHSGSRSRGKGTRCGGGEREREW